VDNDGKRLDVLMSEMIEDVSRSRAQTLIENGHVRVDGDVCLIKKTKPHAGSIITIELPEPEELDVQPENIPIDIVYEDDDVMVVNKPRGMVVHPAPGNLTGTLVNAVLYHCGDSLSSINGIKRPGIVHRIDKDTSGLLMIAKTDRSHISLSEQLYEHSITRKYLALVRDNIKEDKGTVDASLGRDRRDRKKRSVSGIDPKRAVTHFRVLERFGVCTLVELILETGRTHQIRVHMASIKHPVLGDPMYGKGEEVLSFNGSHIKIASGQMLHAGVIGFIHPVTGEYMEFTADLPEDFKAVLDALRK
jgi:23S rRNA pseudouridine1911/1915/1917 synthase